MGLQNKSIHLETFWDSAEKKIITSSVSVGSQPLSVHPGELQDAIGIPVSFLETGVLQRYFINAYLSVSLLRERYSTECKYSPASSYLEMKDTI